MLWMGSSKRMGPYRLARERPILVVRSTPRGAANVRRSPGTARIRARIRTPLLFAYYSPAVLTFDALAVYALALNVNERELSIVAEGDVLGGRRQKQARASCANQTASGGRPSDRSRRMKASRPAWPPNKCLKLAGRRRSGHRVFKYIQSTTENGELGTWTLMGSSNLTGPGRAELKERLRPGVSIVARGYPPCYSDR